jgi:membrane protein DedA with SNARE-associated domain
VLATIISTDTLDSLLRQYGYAAVFAFVAVESLGVPFPGETMLVVAAIYAGTTQHLAIELVWAAAAAGAIIGDNVGYWIGRVGGYPLLRRYGPKIKVDESRLKVGRLLFDRYGGKVVFFGRFVSILRTYAAFLAGTNRMRYLRFLAFNAAGGILWSAIYAFGFYYLGNTLKHVQTPFDVVIGVVAVIVVVAFGIWIRRNAKDLESEAEDAYPGPLD